LPCRLFLLATLGIKITLKIMFRVQHSGLSALLVLMSIFCLSSEAFAAGVVTSATENSLVAAMAGGGTVTFAVNGTIYLTSTIAVSDDTVLDATGQNVVISGSNSVQIFIINSNTTLAMTNLTLRDGFVQGPANACGGAISNAGTLEITDCIFMSNSAVCTNHYPGGDGYGGAIYNSGTLQVAESTFESNAAASLVSLK
jgi:hypothetical protein